MRRSPARGRLTLPAGDRRAAAHRPHDDGVPDRRSRAGRLREARAEPRRPPGVRDHAHGGRKENAGPGRGGGRRPRAAVLRTALRARAAGAPPTACTPHRSTGVARGVMPFRAAGTDVAPASSLRDDSLVSEPRAVAQRAGEVVPGLWHWNVDDERIGGFIGASHAVATDDGTVLVDPHPLAEDAFAGLGEIAGIVLTASVHQRAAWRLRRELGVPVWV